MTTGQFLHIAINFKSGAAKMKELEPAFNKALDWLRYAPNCWIVWTTSDPAKWYARLKPVLDEADTFFICKIDIDTRYGWLPKSTWNWINKDRASDGKSDD